MQTFADLGVPTPLVAALTARGATEPFPVQAATLPDALAGRDLCGRAPTGSGKTLAFGIPVLARLAAGPVSSPRRPRALVLAPTRELAAQIERELEPLAAAVGRTVFSVYGGVGYEKQRQALRQGVDVLVACPGRLVDLIDQGSVTLDSVDVVVIDEADRMSDMGFLPVVRRLLDRTPDTRQTVLFSATLDGDVAVLTKRYQRNAVRHEVGDAEPDILSARHLFWRAESPADRLRQVQLVAEGGSTIVFCRTRHRADRVAKQLVAAGEPAVAIHGGRSQGQRDRALDDFTVGRVRVMVATDVAARGIHVDGVASVVHYDPPADDKTYVHRSGRTARAGASGTVVSLLGTDEVRDAKALQRSLGIPVTIGAADAGAIPAVPWTPAPPAAPVQAAPSERTRSPRRRPQGAGAGQTRRPRAGAASGADRGRAGNPARTTAGRSRRAR